MSNISNETVEDLMHTLVGRTMELTEAIGLPEKQEKAYKTQLKRLIYKTNEELQNEINGVSNFDITEYE